MSKSRDRVGRTPPQPPGPAAGSQGLPACCLFWASLSLSLSLSRSSPAASSRPQGDTGQPEPGNSLLSLRAGRVLCCVPSEVSKRSDELADLGGRLPAAVGGGAGICSQALHTTPGSRHHPSARVPAPLSCPGCRNPVPLGPQTASVNRPGVNSCFRPFFALASGQSSEWAGEAAAGEGPQGAGCGAACGGAVQVDMASSPGLGACWATGRAGRMGMNGLLPGHVGSVGSRPHLTSAPVPFSFRSLASVSSLGGRDRTRRAWGL